MASPKNIVIAKATELGASFTKVHTKNVSFTDLARGEAKFIYFHNLTWTNSNRFDELKATAREHGFILSSAY